MTRLPDFPIPEVVTPESRVCVQFSIPDSPAYRQILMGWMLQLRYYFNWQRDEAHSAIICSNLFKQSFDELVESLSAGCGEIDTMYLRMRVSPDNSRISQAQYEVDGDWIEFLDNTCCGVTNTLPTVSRITEGGTLEVSTDGGMTWVPDPTDPRSTLAILPLPTGGDVKCKVARSIVASIANQQEVLSADAGAWGGISGLVVVLLELLTVIGIIGTGGALAPILVGISAALLAAGKAVFDAAMTSAVYDRLQEIVYCALESDGNLTSGGWDEIIRKSSNEFVGIAGTFIVKVLQLWQVNGTNQAGRLGLTTENDCSAFSCPCVDHFYAYVGEEVAPYYAGMRSFKSVPQDGVNRVEVRTNEETNCCNILLNYFDLEGETGDHFTPFGAAIWKCGDPWNEPNPGQGFLGDCRNRARFQTHPVLNPDTVFVVSFLTEDCTP